MAGRKSKFNSDLSAKIAALYGAGKTDREVAAAIGVSLRTIHYWKASQPDFLHALKEGKDVADELVVSSLFRRATGYSHPEEKIFTYLGRVVRAKTTKHYPPDVTAQIFWLQNRRPDEWRTREIEPARYEDPNYRPPKLTFEEFCLNARYPRPYATQIEMMNFGRADGDPRLLLGARGYGKTDYVTVLGIAYAVYVDWYDHWYWSGPEEQRPEITETNLIVTKSKPRNSAIIEEIANALEDNGVELASRNKSHVNVKRHLTPEEEEKKKRPKKKGKDHSVEVLTIKSSFRGRHPKRLVMDDPVTEEDTSEATRDLVKTKYSEAYKLCKNIVLIGQPAHAFDLYAELRNKLRKMEVPHGSIPELDADLVAMRAAGIDSNSISMSYHLLIPEDSAMPFSRLKFLPSFPTGDSVAFIDPSDGGDFTSVSIIKGYMDGVAVQGHAWQRAWYHCLEELVPILQKLGVRRVCFETNATGNQPIGQLVQILGPLGIGVVGKFSDTNKHAAIMAAASYAHLIHLSHESDRAYTDQVVKYEKGVKYDDAPDSLARGLEWLGLIRGRSKK